MRKTVVVLVVGMILLAAGPLAQAQTRSASQPPARTNTTREPAQPRSSEPMSIKQTEPAKEHLREVLRLAPNGTDARLLLGVVCAQQQQFYEAAEYLTAETKLNPRSVLAFYNLGLVRAEQKKWAEASVSLRRACALQPDEPRFHRALAKTLRQLGKTAEAEQQDNEAARLEGGEP